MSNQKGEFEIKANLSDTLIFSSMIYQTGRIPVKNLTREFNYVTLIEQVYELTGVDIKEERWKDFKYNMMNLELKPEEKEIFVLDGLPNPYTVLVPCEPHLLSNPLTFLYEYFKRENVIKRKQKRWRTIYEKSQNKLLFGN